MRSLAEQAWELVERDIAPMRPLLGDVRVVSLSHLTADDRAVIGDPESWDGYPNGYVVVCDRNTHSLGPALDLDSVVLELAGYLQDEIIDRLGRPWPTAADRSAPGGTVVFDVVRAAPGRVVWRAARQPDLPVGELQLLGRTWQVGQ